MANCKVVLKATIFCESEITYTFTNVRAKMWIKKLLVDLKTYNYTLTDTKKKRYPIWIYIYIVKFKIQPVCHLRPEKVVYID